MTTRDGDYNVIIFELLDFINLVVVQYADNSLVRQGQYMYANTKLVSNPILIFTSGWNI